MPAPLPAPVAISHLWRYDGLDAVARALAAEDRLAAFYVPLDVTRLSRIARRVPGGRRAERILLRRAGVPRAVSTSVVSTLAISALARLPMPRYAARARRSLYSRWNRNHDQVVASRLRRLRPAVYLAAGIPATYSLSAARALGIPSVFSVSEDPWDLVEVARLEVGGDPAFAAAASANLAEHRAAIREATCVAVESGHVAAHLRSEGVDSSRIITLGQGVDPLHFPFRPRPQGSRPLRVLTVSRPTPFKGLGYLVEAVRIARDAVESFRWLGRGAIPVTMAATAAAMASLPDATYDGEVPFTQVPAAYERADVFVLPSLADSMARAVLEAMSSGLPVIVTPQSGYGDVIRDGVDGFIVPPRDPHAIAARLTTLSADPGLRASMGAAARATAETFTWGRYTQRLLDGLATFAEPGHTARLERR